MLDEMTSSSRTLLRSRQISRAVVGPGDKLCEPEPEQEQGLGELRDS